MTTLLQVNRLGHEYDGRAIFGDLSLQLAAGEKVGLIGRNGSGKSTLLRIIAGMEEPARGLVRLHLPPERVSYLPQEPDIPGQKTVREYAASLSGGGAGPEQWAVFKYLDQLGLGRQDYGKRTAALSGGEKSRLCLARLLGADCGLLLLDEPTTHLDTRGLEWLEGYLASYRGAAIIVSHDRIFLDRTVHRILELDQGGIRSFPGSYSEYARIKEEEQRARWSAYRDYRCERKRITASLHRKRQWARQAAAASSPRTPYLAARAKKVDRVVQSVERRLERLDTGAPSKPWESRRLRLNFAGGEKTGPMLIKAAGAGYAYGKRELFWEVSFTIFEGDAAVLTGPNGAGKTTLLRLILGELEAGRGQVSLSPAARVGYLGQDHEQLAPSRTVLETVEHAGERDGTAARHLLGALLFGEEQFCRPVGTLSGGEKKRLVFATLLARRANLLILDEPTNHLDIESREAIEAALDGFQGTILAVSHDRYFLHRLSSRVLALAEGRLLDYPGNYGEYLESRRRPGPGGREEILVLENRLAFLSGRLDELAGVDKPQAAAEREQAGREFIEIGRRLNALKKD